MGGIPSMKTLTDQRHLVYASMSAIVHIVNVGSPEIESLANITEIHEGLDFFADDDGGYSFGIFSVKFSTDGQEVVAGSSDDSIYVYDLESNKFLEGDLYIITITWQRNSQCTSILRIWDLPKDSLYVYYCFTRIVFGHYDGFCYSSGIRI
ncbi:hypothetical protein F2P56_023176 [Juglans regia]|uniref:LEC14B protein-like n=2 Tax=Juglans regia TaxID=51240 RepID=A0A833U1U5_JUGRE|nr:LEC14B protein-like [Juglans regia]KAF5459201.1 hypothetical protein F2P56_023176 [Juglans regia]